MDMIICVVIMVLLSLVIGLLIILIMHTSNRNNIVKQNSHPHEMKEIMLEPFRNHAFEKIIYKVQGQVKLGSNRKKSDIVFDFDKDVKSIHIVISITNGNLFVAKAHKKVDLYINGLPIQNRRELKNQDVISFGGIDAVISILK